LSRRVLAVLADGVRPALSPQTNLGTVSNDRSILLLSGKR
jgi:hypothetical protein